jgi:hypothetical protein
MGFIIDFKSIYSHFRRVTFYTTVRGSLVLLIIIINSYALSDRGHHGNMIRIYTATIHDLPLTPLQCNMNKAKSNTFKCNSKN